MPFDMSEEALERLARRIAELSGVPQDVADELVIGLDVREIDEAGMLVLRDQAGREVARVLEAALFDD